MEGLDVIDEPTYQTLGLSIGSVFDTPYEQGCEVASEPDTVGNFDGWDSDHVLCSFSPLMVIPSSVRKGSK